MISESSPLIYFGKIPSRGDFIKSRSHSLEIDAIDRWVSDALVENNALFITSPTSHIYFSHVDTSSNEAITGVLVPSTDTTSRSYPLIGLNIQHFKSAKTWLNYLATNSYPLWRNIHFTLKQAKQQQDDVEALNTLNECVLNTDETLNADYYDFINRITFEECAQLLGCHKDQLAQQLIATGLLFLPTFTKGFVGLNKQLSWQLTQDLTSSIKIATFWHDLINGFYQPHDININTYIYQQDNRFMMVLSFNDLEGLLLSQLISQSQSCENKDSWVCMQQSEWTRNYIIEDIGLNRLYKILVEDGLYLFDVRQLFKQAFLAQ